MPSSPEKQHFGSGYTLESSHLSPNKWSNELFAKTMDRDAANRSRKREEDVKMKEWVDETKKKRNGHWKKSRAGKGIIFLTQKYHFLNAKVSLVLLLWIMGVGVDIGTEWVLFLL